jgi:outer membrane protein assembly factor BamB
MMRIPGTSGRPAMIIAGRPDVVALAACGSASAAATTAKTVQAKTAKTAKTAASPAATIPGCRVGAWADDFTDAGRLAWQVSLPANPGLGYGRTPPQPLAVGDVTVFADGDDLYALRLSDGHPLWHRAFGTAKDPAAGYVMSTVAWHASAVALLAADTDAPKLVSLDAATGKVRWTAAVYTDPYATPLITAGHVITVAATVDTGTVVSRSAQTGAVRWKAVISPQSGRYLAQPEGPDVLVAFPPASASQPSRLLALDGATGATRATDLLPYTATVDAPVTVTGADALLEPETSSCVVPVAPGPAASEPSP